MRVLKRLEQILESEIEKIVDKGDITPGEVEMIYKVVDVMKDIKEICHGTMEDDYGYAKGRDSMGRYTSRRDNSYRGSYNRGGYSGHGSNDMISKLENMMNEAGTERERMVIQSWIDEMES